MQTTLEFCIGATPQVCIFTEKATLRMLEIRGKPSEGKYCENCDLELPADAEFCPECGEEVG